MCRGKRSRCGLTEPVEVEGLPQPAGVVSAPLAAPVAAARLEGGVVQPLARQHRPVGGRHRRL